MAKSIQELIGRRAVINKDLPSETWIIISNITNKGFDVVLEESGIKIRLTDGELYIQPLVQME